MVIGSLLKNDVVFNYFYKYCVIFSSAGIVLPIL